MTTTTTTSLPIYRTLLTVRDDLITATLADRYGTILGTVYLGRYSKSRSLKSYACQAQEHTGLCMAWDAVYAWEFVS